MVALIKNNLKAIQGLCIKHHVRSLYVFGSAVSEKEFNLQSDIDFLYEIDTEQFKDWASENYDYIDNLTDLEKQLNTLLSRKIDLIPYKNIHNSYFKKNVDSNRQLIYGS